jgi:integrase
MKPAKPRADFPLFPDANGQWAKKVNKKKYYFGSWKDDPQGDAAISSWMERKAGILAGLDSMTRKGQVGSTKLTLSQLRDEFLSVKALAVTAGELSAATLKDYRYETGNLLKVFPGEGQVAALEPKHFSTYAKHLISERKLGRHARRRVTAYVKAMFAWGSGNGRFPAVTFGTDFVAPDTSPDAMRQSKARAGIADHSRRIVSGDEITRLLGRAQPNFQAMILLGVNCGLGPADLGRLRWSHLNLETGELNMPRGKTGTDRKGYMWKSTRKALARVAKLRHAAKAIEKEGQAALVFITRKGLPVYREVEVKGRIVVSSAISITFGRMARELKLDGVTFYRLRHTMKTLGKKAKDRDALNLMMGHAERSTGEVYDHEDISLARIRRVARRVYRGLWPKLKPVPMRLAA